MRADPSSRIGATGGLSMFPSILIVDDEMSIIRSLGGLLTDEGYEVLSASNGYEALKIIDAESPDLVLLDIWMPGIDGLETLKEIKRTNPFVQVIIISGHGTIETAVKATKLGAFDFIEKPLSIDKVIVTINNALEFRRLEEENRYLRKKTIEKHSITGFSDVTQALRKQIAVAAPKDAWILITGENGTGKELIARSIHQLSSRSDKPMIDVNCAAIPDELIESELFGHEKGAFPGAAAKKRGKFELAAGGSIFLDEIADMSMKTQGKILRVLEEQQFQRLGGGRTIGINARIISATNKDLEHEIVEGRFREELYYRLNVIPIHVPPLRERKGDIPLMIETFLKEAAADNRGDVKTMSDAAVDIMVGYDWPGNVRELKNLVERLAIMVERDVIDVKDIPALSPRNVEAVETPTVDKLLRIDHLKEAKKAFEKEFIQRRMAACDNNVTKTAEAIGVARSYLHRKLKE
jgi:two-component system nitrogen regulation response regulator NtrX